MRDRGAVPALLLRGSEKGRLAQQHCSCAAFCTPEEKEITPSSDANTLHYQCHHCIVSAATIPTTAADLPPSSAPKCVRLQPGTTTHTWQPDPQELEGGKGSLMGPAAIPGMGMGNLGQICCMLPNSICKCALGKSGKHC